jgi:hypothetical protein
MTNIWNACREQRAADAARKAEVAARVRAVARELGAVLEDGRWSLTCPCCGQTTSISEDGGVFISWTNRPACRSAGEIARRVRGGGL